MYPTFQAIVSQEKGVSLIQSQHKGNPTAMFPFCSFRVRFIMLILSQSLRLFQRSTESPDLSKWRKKGVT